MSRPTYSAAVREAERLRGEMVEQAGGRASRAELSRFEDDPVAWDLEAGRDPTDYQREVMRSVADNKRTAWRGCHACGKDFTLGSLAVWAAYARGSLVLVVSATEQQVVHQTMREVRKAWRAARKAHGIGGELYQGSVRIGGEDRIVALTGSASVDALTGWHDHENGVVVLISEGQGERLEEAAYDAAEGNVTTDRGRILAAGNPVRPGGRFYSIHQRSSWERFQTSAHDTPNVKAGEVVRPGFPAPDWPEDVAGEYGEGSSFFKGRVLAEFPEEAEEALIRRGWIQDAVERFESGALEGDAEFEPLVVGVDVARSGADLSAAAVRQGPIVRELVTWRAEDTMESVDRVERLLDRFTSPETPRLEAVVVDEAGLGAGVCDRLTERLKGRPYPYRHRRQRPGATITRTKSAEIEVEGFNSSRKAGDPERFANLRAHVYWRIRKRLEDGRLALPDDAELGEELWSTRWKVTGSGLMQLEAKEDLKRRIGRSPDRADSLAMTFGRAVMPRGKGVWFV